MGLSVNGSVYKLDTLIPESTAIKLSLYSETRVAPNLAAAVAVAAGATAWEYGAAAAIIATGGVASAFQITGISVESVASSGSFQLALFEGTAASSAVAAISFRGATASLVSQFIPVVTKQIAAGKSVKAKVAALTTTGPAPSIKITYKVG